MYYLKTFEAHKLVPYVLKPKFLLFLFFVLQMLTSGAQITLRSDRHLSLESLIYQAMAENNLMQPSPMTVFGNLLALGVSQHLFRSR